MEVTKERVKGMLTSDLSPQLALLFESDGCHAMAEAAGRHLEKFNEKIGAKYTFLLLLGPGSYGLLFFKFDDPSAEFLMKRMQLISEVLQWSMQFKNYVPAFICPPNPKTDWLGMLAHYYKEELE